jgi:hypothetical protein
MIALCSVEECVLMYDLEKKQFTLEVLASTVNLKWQRPSRQSAAT